MIWNSAWKQKKNVLSTSGPGGRPASRGQGQFVPRNGIFSPLVAAGVLDLGGGDLDGDKAIAAKALELANGFFTYRAYV